MNHNKEYQLKALDDIRQMIPLENARVLEIGSDESCNILHSLEENNISEGIGVNPAFEEYNQGKICRLKADARALPFEDNSIDAIISLATFEHIHELPIAIKELERVLKKDGHIYVSFGPIWTSAKGHHLCVSDEKESLNFWNDKSNPLPPFSHLLNTRESLTKLLENKCSPSTTAKIVDWVFETPSLNRLDFTGYLNALYQSDMNILHIEPESVITPGPETLKALEQAHGKEQLYHITGFNLLLQKKQAAPQFKRLQNKSEYARPLATRNTPINTRYAVICPSEICNYRCSYCSQDHKHLKTDRPLSQWLTALKAIGAPEVHLTGGEPTFFKGIEDFVLNYPSAINMTTNLSYDPEKFSPDFWQKIKHHTLSFHPEFTSLEEFKERVQKLYSLIKNPDDAVITVVAVPGIVERLPKIITELNKTGIQARGQYAILPDLNYSEQELQTLKKVPMSAEESAQILYDHQAPKLCNAGMFYTQIKADGSAYTCLGNSTYMGNVFDGSFKWMPHELICRKTCQFACDRYHNNFKVLEEEKAPVYEEKTLLFKMGTNQSPQMKMALSSLKNIAQKHKKLLFLGAGKHSLNLIDEIYLRRKINDDIPTPEFIVDDNPQAIQQAREYYSKQSKKQMSPEQILEATDSKNISFDAVILATDSWQEELSIRAKELWPKDTPIFDLYAPETLMK